MPSCHTMSIKFSTAAKKNGSNKNFALGGISKRLFGNFCRHNKQHYRAQNIYLTIQE